MEKHQFKPFEQVLVRNTEDQVWKPNFYSFEGYNGNGHLCTNDMKYIQCIPYNEETAHLLGTTESYEQPKPKTYRVEWVSGDKLHKMEYTDEEFENFIKTAVLHNKDVSNFNVRKICG